jgi:hypothetical protein
MGATRSLFKYKCVSGHVTTKVFALGTRINDYDETTCPECLKQGDVKPTYIVFAGFTSAEKTK